MVEVFKTNVKDPDHAKMLVGLIHTTFVDYSANFDLEDCDKILRVTSSRGFLEVSTLLRIVKSFGFEAEVLSDEQPVNDAFQVLK